MSDLPYDFDLLYDIKTKLQLKHRYLELLCEMVSLEETMALHGINKDLMLIEDEYGNKLSVKCDIITTLVN